MNVELSDASMKRLLCVHERWISDESIFSISTKKYEETIMNVHERWISDESIISIST